jgi:serine/threonine-protein kinase
MEPDRWQRIQSLFEQALTLEPGARDAFLLEACDEDREMLEEVRALLHHDQTGGDNIESAVRDAAEDMLSDVATRRAGQRYGPWELVEHISDGGMGAVYLARRADGAFEQQAALKLLNPALVGEQARRRMESERQILANLNHPNIARLLDGGTGPDGVPFLVMEYVDGQPIDFFCNGRGLDTRARLTLFKKVCAAIEYAHRNLVVHRDIKPSNILVEANGEPKLLDFGISKLLGSEDPGITQVDQRLFTPAHASPEQITGAAITTATDVYALGILLYDLLVGRLPYVDETKTTENPALIARRILETEPVTPSAAITQGSSERLEALKQRGEQLTPARLQKELQGDLDNIVLMALRKEPERRYPSVRALSLDVDRYLQDRPIQARPDSLAYRARKLFKRRRGPILAAALAVVVLIAQSVFYFQRIVAERDAAEEARANAENVVAFLEELLQGADRWVSGGREVTVRDILDNGAQRIDTELGGQPIEKARLIHTIASTYNAVSVYETALPMAEEALELRRSALGPTHRDTLESMRLVATVVLRSGDPVTAEKKLEEVLELQQTHLGPDAGEVGMTLRELGVVRRVLGKPQSSLESHEAAIAIFSEQPPTSVYYRMLPDEMNQVGNALNQMEKFEESIEAHKRALELFESTGQASHPAYGAAMHNLGMSMGGLGRSEEALPYLHDALEHTRTVLGEMSEDFEAQAATLGRTYSELERWEEAEEYAFLALDTAEKLYGKQHQYYAYNLVNVARLRQMQDRHEESLVLLEEATAIYRDTFGPYQRFLAAAEVGQGISMNKVGRADEAVVHLEGVLERLNADPEHERHVEAVGRSAYGRALVLVGRTDEGRVYLTESLAFLEETLGEDHHLTRVARERFEESFPGEG